MSDKENEEYYRRRVQSILIGRKERLAEAMQVVYGTGRVIKQKPNPSWLLLWCIGALVLFVVTGVAGFVYVSLAAPVRIDPSPTSGVKQKAVSPLGKPSTLPQTPAPPRF